MYKFRYTKSFVKQYARLPEHIQKKVKKQLRFLSKDLFHPSLYTRKMQSTNNIWECRVDYSYRIVFEIHDEEFIILLFVGTHEIYRKVA